MTVSLSHLFDLCVLLNKTYIRIRPHIHHGNLIFTPKKVKILVFLRKKNLKVPKKIRKMKKEKHASLRN